MSVLAWALVETTTITKTSPETWTTDLPHQEFIAIRLIYTHDSPDLAKRNTIVDLRDTFSFQYTWFSQARPAGKWLVSPRLEKRPERNQDERETEMKINSRMSAAEPRWRGCFKKWNTVITFEFLYASTRCHHFL